MPSAKKFYGLALSKDPWMAKVAFKRLLLGLGNAGVFLRKRLGAAI